MLAQDTFLQMVARLVDASEQIGEDTSRQLGDNSRQLGDTSRQMGDTSRQMGDTSRQLGDTSRQLGDTSRQLGDTSRQLGDTNRQEQDWAGVKAAIWAVAHVASSPAASRWAETVLVSELR